MNMARSTFYKRPNAEHAGGREKADADLRVRIEDILAEFPSYGYRRITHELRRRGQLVNHKRVSRVMREHALTPRRVRAWLATTNSKHKQPVYPNLRCSITPVGPDELWVADLTYIRLTTGFVFLAVVLDAWSRRVIGVSHLLDRRITHELRRRGQLVNHKRVSRVMREHALTPRRVRAWLATTNSKHKQPVYPNLRCSITPVGPDELWVADLTYIRLTTGFVFLAVVLDAWSSVRRVIGYAISHLLDTRLCLAALDAALDLRRPRAGLVHHSDRGVQYASQAYRSRLAAHRIRGSMSRRGNPYDNAHVESFFKTLKHEEIFANDYSTIDDVADRLPHFLEEVYNRRRLHSSLGYMPPEEFESIHAA